MTSGKNKPLLPDFLACWGPVVRLHILKNCKLTHFLLVFQPIVLVNCYGSQSLRNISYYYYPFFRDMKVMINTI